MPELVIDPERPVSSLEDAGVALSRVTHARSSSIYLSDALEIDTGSFAKHHYTWTLPFDAEVHASFGREGLAQRFIKIFSTELQAGDEAFDEVVYIQTESEERTAALLTSAPTRRFIQQVVEQGGTVLIDGARIVVALPGDDEHDDLLGMAHLVAAVARLTQV